MSGVAEAHARVGGDHEPPASRRDVLAAGAGVTVCARFTLQRRRRRAARRSGAPSSGAAGSGRRRERAHLSPPPCRAPAVRALELRRRAGVATIGAVVLSRVATARRSTTPRRDGRARRCAIAPAVHRPACGATRTRSRELDKVIRERVLVGPTVRVKVWAADGRIVYSDARALIGERYPLRPDCAPRSPTARRTPRSPSSRARRTASSAARAARRGLHAVRAPRARAWSSRPTAARTTSTPRAGASRAFLPLVLVAADRARRRPAAARHVPGPARAPAGARSRAARPDAGNRARGRAAAHRRRPARRRGPGPRRHRLRAAGGRRPAARGPVRRAGR